MDTEKDIEVYKRQRFGQRLGYGISPVLVVIDFTNGFADPNILGGGNIPFEIAHTRELLSAAREVGIPIAYTRHAYASEDPAYITVDRFGAPRCAGGFCSTVRDLARLGQLMMQGGVREGRQILPEAWVQSIIGEGDSAAWDRGDFIELFPELSMHYRDQWYVIRSPGTVIFGFGVFGQHLFVDFENKVVIAKLSSHSEPLDASKIHLTTNALLAIGQYLRR